MPWTNITNAQLAVGAPIRSIDLLALRDNIVALGNQEAGAPTIVKSLNGQNGTITNTSVNTIGSYIIAFAPATIQNGGNTVAGSGLRYWNKDIRFLNTIDDSSTRSSASLGYSGTWRIMSWTDVDIYGVSYRANALYVRIA